MEFLQEYWVFLIPLFVVQLGLAIAALPHILRHDTYKTGSRPLWIVICLLINIIGPVLYFAIGRGDE